MPPPKQCYSLETKVEKNIHVEAALNSEFMPFIQSNRRTGLCLVMDVKR